MSEGLQVQSLEAGYRGGPPVVQGVDLHAPRGAITALLGPNGAGKSTLLKAIVGLVPCRGRVALDGELLAGLDPAQRARRVAYVPQRTQLTARLPVRAVVGLGRFSHRAVWQRSTAADHDAVDRAMVDAGVVDLAERPFPELSGGEQQRVLLARALATGATALLLDEPTAALDVRHALGLHRVLRGLADRGCCVVLVLHDLNEVRQHVDHAVLLQAGRVFRSGPAMDVVAPEPVRAVYGVELTEGAALSWQLPEDPS